MWGTNSYPANQRIWINLLSRNDKDATPADTYAELIMLQRDTKAAAAPTA